ncbi:MAG: serine/threonine protein kinase [Polyangiaceae bacterium]|nr:serine/threonine protein kinase [Polyangiaceae bacterium]
MSTRVSPLASDDAPAPGTIVAGKYRVEHVLGVGGMGVVVAATHEMLGELVAIKFLKTTDNEDRIKRFVREARAAAKIRSEHVARVYDVGQLDDGMPYLVMEHLDGEDLSQRLKRAGPLPIEEAVEYTLQACEAIATAHALGIVHRDLKPSNLFLANRPDGTASVKVIDFGISKMLNDEPTEDEDPGGGITKSATLLGSPLYMSPEQMVSARDVDARCDVWALGGILYALVTGKPPFRGLTVAAIYESILTGGQPLGALCPEAPPELEAAVARALVKDRSVRTPDVASFAADIAPFGPEHARVSVDRMRRLLGGRTGPGSGPEGRPSSRGEPRSTPSGSGASSPDARSSPDAVTRSSVRDGASPVVGASPSVSVAEPGATAASWSREKTPLHRFPTGMVAVGGVAAIAIVAAVYFALRPRGTVEGAPAASAASAPTETTATATPAPSATPASSPSAVASASAVASSAAPSASAAASPRATASQPATPRATTTAVRPPPTSTQPTTDPFGSPR